MYWKRRAEAFDLCRVKVFILEVQHQLPAWREQDERETAWLLVDDAATLVDDAGLVTIIRDLAKTWPRRKTARPQAPKTEAREPPPHSSR